MPSLHSIYIAEMTDNTSTQFLCPLKKKSLPENKEISRKVKQGSARWPLSATANTKHWPELPVQPASASTPPRPRPGCQTRRPAAAPQVAPPQGPSPLPPAGPAPASAGPHPTAYTSGGRLRTAPGTWHLGAGRYPRDPGRKEGPGHRPYSRT